MTIEKQQTLFQGLSRSPKPKVGNRIRLPDWISFGFIFGNIDPNNGLNRITRRDAVSFKLIVKIKNNGIAKYSKYI